MVAQSFFALLMSLTVLAQVPGIAAAEFAAIRARQLPADTAPGSEELIIRLPDALPAGAPAPVAAPVLPLVARAAQTAAAVRERDPQLASDRLVVIAYTADGAVADWRVAPDPRIVRSEQPNDATGLLSGRVLLQTGVDLHVPIAALPSIALVRIYQPRWNGAAFDLEPVGSVDLRR